MKEVNKLKISEALAQDYTEVVQLFNKNQVYQFPNCVPLTERDLEITMKIKEVSNLFLLRNHNGVIGTSAFFKFITHGCLDWESSYSGFLLIDSENRSGQAISFLYKEILEKITKLGVVNLYTEISKYNKASLSLSKLNGFKEYSETYEDILHCRSLKSNLPKILSTFRLSDYCGKEYDLSTFKIIEEVENPVNSMTEMRIKVSEEEIFFKMEDDANLPYFLKMDLFQIGILEKRGQYFLQVDFLSNDLETVRVKVGKYKFVTLTRNKPIIALSKHSKVHSIQASLLTKHGNIDVQLERRQLKNKNQEIFLERKFLGYDLSISPNGSLIFSKKRRLIFEDSFLLFSFPAGVIFNVKEGRKCIYVELNYQGASIKKTIQFDDNENNSEIIKCFYCFNKKAKKLFPDLLKQVFKIYPQEYLIKEGEYYRPYIPGIYPVELDDFIRSDDFEKRTFSFYVPSEGKQIHYNPAGKASNQMQFRPLSIIESTKVKKIAYQFKISDVPFTKENIEMQRYWENKFPYLETNNNMLKNLQNVHVEEEKNYGTKRLLTNRKKYPHVNPLFYYNQIVLPVDSIPIDSDLFSISFDYKIRGEVYQIRYGERVPYDNKAYILENIQELLLYDVNEDRYIQFLANNGVFYSYRENNKLKVRCIFSSKFNCGVNLKIKEYRKSKENEYNL